MQPKNPAGLTYGKISSKDVRKIKNRATKFFATNRRLFTDYCMTHKDIIQECLLVAHEMTVMYPKLEGDSLSKMIHKKVGWHLHNLFGFSCRNKEIAQADIYTETPAPEDKNSRPIDYFPALTEIQNKVLSLKIEGLTTRETAFILGVSYQRIEQILKRATKKIKTLIEKGDYDEGLKQYISPQILGLCKRSE